MVFSLRRQNEAPEYRYHVFCAAILFSVLATQRGYAADKPTTNATDTTAPLEQNWAIHGQSTYTQEFQPAFRSPYQGPQSLSPPANGRETFDATIYAGFRPWPGAEIWINPEVDQGFGLGNSFGVAGYVSGEAYKLGQNDLTTGCRVRSSARPSIWAARPRRSSRTLTSSVVLRRRTG